LYSNHGLLSKCFLLFSDVFNDNCITKGKYLNRKCFDFQINDNYFLRKCNLDSYCDLFEPQISSVL